MKKLLWVSSILISFSAQVGFAKNLEEYLSEVKKGNTGFSASVQASQGIQKRSGEAKLLISPIVFASIQNTLDQNPARTVSVQGEKMTAQTYSLGVSQTTTLGLTAKASYSLTSVNISGANSAMVPESSFFDSKPNIELSYALWRNMAGKELQEQISLAQTQLEAQSLGEKYKARMLLFEAEIAFWRLAAAQKTVILQKETLERAKKIREWNFKRVQNQLADQSDLLQANAVIKFRELELTGALDEEESAARNFNSLRGLSSNKVTEKITLPTEKEVESIQLTPYGPRDDIKVAIKQTQLARSQANIGLEKTKPTLEAFANLSLDSRQHAIADSFKDSYSAKYPSNTIGVRLSMPFNGAVIDSNREGYQQEILASELNLQRKQFDSEQEHRDLTVKYQDAVNRWKLARTIEQLQKEKYEYEKGKLNRGRSLTYQVLNFEQDLTTAQLTTLRTEFEILRLQAQLKTFAGDSPL